MRTYLEIDDALLAEATRLTGLRTKREVIEEALRALIGLHRQEDILGAGDQIAREGSLDDMRPDKPTK
jgi:Arc/MetJ family transcription regulator